MSCEHIKTCTDCQRIAEEKMTVPPFSPLCLECKEVRTDGFLCQKCTQKAVAESSKIAELERKTASSLAISIWSCAACGLLSKHTKKPTVATVCPHCNSAPMKWWHEEFKEAL